MRINSALHFQPVIFNRKKTEDDYLLEQLISKNEFIQIIDLFESQKTELIKTRNCSEKRSDQNLKAAYQVWLSNNDPLKEGTWVYYSWSNRLIHILEEAEFIELRTSRNQHKITEKEQDLLRTCKIGIIGLSVGNAVAITMASERICGHIKLADFDTLELSNMNRIRTGLHNIGINKCIITAREIAEIDPFIKVECYTEGITVQNIESFLDSDGPLNILVDECDDLQIKIYARIVARQRQIPVVMETSDRGMLDVERFDKEHNRSILHGYLDDIKEEDLLNILPEQRLPLVMRIINAAQSSARGRASLFEMGKSIGTWPQLASAVTLGGGVVTDVCRRILLDKFTISGRFYVDLESIIANQIKHNAENVIKTDQEFDLDLFEKKSASLRRFSKNLSKDILEDLILKATRVSSLYNMQPWKWVIADHIVYIVIDEKRNLNFWDFEFVAAKIAIGSAVEEFISNAKKLGFFCEIQSFEPDISSKLIGAITFANNVEVVSNDLNILTDLEVLIKSFAFEEEIAINFDNKNGRITSHIDFVTVSNPDAVKNISTNLGQLEFIGILQPLGHAEYFQDILKTDTHTDQLFKGKSISQLNLNAHEDMAFKMLQDPNLAVAVRDIGKGELFWSALSKQHANCLGYLFLKQTQDRFLDGRIIQFLNNQFLERKLTLEPVLFSLSLFERIKRENNYCEEEIKKINEIIKSMNKFIVLDGSFEDYYVIKILQKDSNNLVRLPLIDVLLVENFNN